MTNEPFADPTNPSVSVKNMDIKFRCELHGVFSWATVGNVSAVPETLKVSVYRDNWDPGAFGGRFAVTGGKLKAETTDLNFKIMEKPWYAHEPTIIASVSGSTNPDAIKFPGHWYTEGTINEVDKK